MRLLLPLLLCITSPACALDTQELLAACEQLEGTGQDRELSPADYGSAQYCIGYVMGFEDAQEIGKVRGGTPMYCLPTDNSVTAKQRALIVASYIRAHPEGLHLHPAVNAFKALSAAFPCR